MPKAGDLGRGYHHFVWRWLELGRGGGGLGVGLGSFWVPIAYVVRRLGRVVRFVDGRLLMWLLVAVFASGVPLAVWFDADATRAVSLVERWLRGAHAVSTALLVLGTVLHLVMRLRGRVEPRVVRWGGLSLAFVGLAAATGALVDQTGHGARAWARLGLDVGAVSAVAVVHVAFASVLVALGVYVHVARKSRVRIFGGWQSAAISLVLVVLGVALLPGVAPGAGSGHIATVAVAPGGFAWPVLVGLVVAVGARWLSSWRGGLA